MGIHTGVSISVINYNTYLKLSRKSTILFLATNVILCAYSGNVVKSRKFEGVTKYNGQKLNHEFVVVDGSRPI